jgi:hypothetical protein
MKTIRFFVMAGRSPGHPRLSCCYTVEAWMPGMADKFTRSSPRFEPRDHSNDATQISLISMGEQPHLPQWQWRTSICFKPLEARLSPPNDGRQQRLFPGLRERTPSPSRHRELSAGRCRPRFHSQLWQSIWLVGDGPTSVVGDPRQSGGRFDRVRSRRVDRILERANAACLHTRSAG